MIKKTVFTISSKNYFAQGITLLDSIYEIHKDELDYNYLIVDEDLEGIQDYNSTYKIHLAKNIGIPDYKRLAFQYDVIEFNTAVKPFFMDFLIKTYQQIIYFDPDIFVFKNISHLFNLLDTHDIILTPHIVNTDFRLTNIEENEQTFLKVGVYNLGFCGVSNTVDGNKFITWFKTRTFNACYNNVKNGLFVDQKWIDFVPCLFQNTHIIYGPEYNIAYWNINERKNIDIQNIVFFHFSSVIPSNNTIIAKCNPKYYNTSNFPAFAFLIKEYNEKLLHNKYLIYKNLKYSYNYFSNGKQILPFHRKLVHKIPKNFNPFDINILSIIYIKGYVLSMLKKSLQKSKVLKSLILDFTR